MSADASKPVRSRPVIAIDGPAGAGKSTLAAYLARRFGLLNLETGAMYRAFALKALESGCPLDEEAPLLALAGTTVIMLEPQPEGGNRVLLDGREVSRRLREPDVTAAASRVSVHPRVRTWMVEQQRKLGLAGGIVMEGRDIGTKVFPDAEVKIFLDAAPEVRGGRRFRQIAPAQDASQKAAEAAVIAELKERDHRDRTRTESPLVAAADAVMLDTTGLTLEQTLTAAEEIVRSHLDGKLSGR
ncbi:MAG TPA: (d)CMP kinase [Granulicella sp.]